MNGENEKEMRKVLTVHLIFKFFSNKASSTTKNFYLLKHSIVRAVAFLSILILVLINSIVASDSASDSKTSIRKGNVIVESEWVKAKPDEHSEDLCKIFLGEFVSIVDESQNWYGIMPPKHAEAWVPANQLKDQTVVGSYTPVFSSPEKFSSTYGILNQNDQVTILEKRDDSWVKIIPPISAIVWVPADSIEVENVNVPPTLSEIPPQTTDEDVPINGIKFTVDEGGYRSEDSQVVTIKVRSSNQNLISDSKIEVDFFDDRSDTIDGIISITPNLNENGKSIITVLANDGEYSVKREFEVTVQPVNDLPVLEDIPDQITEEDKGIVEVKFSADEGGGRDENVQDLVITATSSNRLLLPDANITVEFSDGSLDAGSGFLKIKPAAEQNGVSIVTLTAYDGSKIFQDSFHLTVLPINDPPTITKLQNQVVNEDVPIENLIFTADEGGGADEDIQTLSIWGTSTNQNLVLNNDIHIEYSDDPIYGTQGLISITPLPNKNGQTEITIHIDDGKQTSHENFRVSVKPVNDPPYLSKINDLSVEEDVPLSKIHFLADEGGGADEDSQEIIISATSSNQALITDADISINFIDGAKDADSGIILIEPKTNENGTSVITLSITDGIESISKEFKVNVEPVNDPPTISSIPDQVTNEDAPITSIGFKVDEGGAEDEDSQKLIVTVSSSNQELVSNEGIRVHFSDDGGEGILEITPNPNEVGETSITMEVDDGTHKTSETFQLITPSIRDFPSLSNIPDQFTNEDQPITGVNFQIRNAEDQNSGEEIQVTVRSSNQTLISDDQINVRLAEMANGILEGSLSIEPTANEFGSSKISVIADDGAHKMETTFNVQVNSVDDPPIISNLTNIPTSDDELVRGITFDVDEGGGSDEDVQIMTVLVTSSNSDLISEENILLNFTDDIENPKPGTLKIIPAENTFGTALLTIIADDGSNQTEVAFEVAILPEDVPLGAIDSRIPSSAVNSINPVPEDTEINSTLLATDVDHTSVKFEIIDTPLNGKITNFDENSGEFTYSPNPDYSGKDFFTFRASGHNSYSGEGTIELVITPVDDPPSISEIFDQKTLEDIPIEGIPLAADEGGKEDEDSQTLKFTVTSSNKSLISEDRIKINYADDKGNAGKGTIDIFPQKNQSGTSTISIQVDDGNHQVQTSFEVSVESVNDPPSFSSISNQITDEDLPLTGIPVHVDEGGDSDEDLQIVVLSASSSNPRLIPEKNITIDFEDDEGDVIGGTLDLAPSPNEFGKSMITILADDGEEVAETSFMVEVKPVNDIPVTNTMELVTNEDSSLVENLNAKDIDENKFSVTIVREPKFGKVSIINEESGKISYEPKHDFSGEDSFSFKVNDGFEDSNVSEVSISVVPVDDKPTLSSFQDQVIDEDSEIDPLEFFVDEGGGSDEDKQILEVTAKSSYPDLVPEENIKIVFEDDESDATSGILEIYPLVNESGIAIITLFVSDGNDVVEKNFQLSIIAVNDVPTISTIEDQTSPENKGIIGLEFDADEGGGSDEDSQVLQITAESSNQDLVPNDHIRIDFSDDNSDAKEGTLTITPIANHYGKTRITLTANDGVSSTTQTFDYTVEVGNDPPTASDIDDQQIEEDMSITGIVFKVDEGGDASEDKQILTVKADSSNPKLLPTSNVFIEFSDDATDAKGGTIDLVPVENENGEAVITLTINDGQDEIKKSFALTVHPVNDPPRITGLEDQSIGEDTVLEKLTFMIDEGGGTDEEEQKLKIEVSSSNKILVPDNNITFTISDDDLPSKTGTLSIVPAPNRFGSSKITVSVSDGISVAQKSFSLDIEPVNDVPIVYDYELSTDAGIPVASILRGFDPDGRTIRFEVVGSPEKGQAEFVDASLGTFLYRPSENMFGEDTFTFKASDGIDDSKLATVRIQIEEVDGSD